MKNVGMTPISCLGRTFPHLQFTAAQLPTIDSKPLRKKRLTMPKKKSVKKSTNEDNIDFESAIAKLEGIVNKLEQGLLPLEEALDEYTQAIQLVKVCQQRLEQAERKITLLSGVDADGNPVADAKQFEQEIDDSRKPSTGKQTRGTGDGLSDGLFD